MGIINEFPYIKSLIMWMFIPVGLVSLILGVIAFNIYKKHKYNLTFEKRKQLKILLNLIGILLLGAIFIIMLAFINAFVGRVDLYNLEFTNKFAYYFILISPIVPFLFMLSFVINFFKALKTKEKKLKIDKDEKFDISKIDNFDFVKDDVENDNNSKDEDEEELEII